MKRLQWSDLPMIVVCVIALFIGSLLIGDPELNVFGGIMIMLLTLSLVSVLIFYATERKLRKRWEDEQRRTVDLAYRQAQLIRQQAIQLSMFQADWTREDQPKYRDQLNDELEQLLKEHGNAD